MVSENRNSNGSAQLAVIDVAGYVADLKDHAVRHGFHIHDERHFLETYSLRQNWEVDLHPEGGLGGPVDLHLPLEIDPRTLLSFEDAVNNLDEDDAPPEGYEFPLTFTWILPPLTNGPDLLLPATELAAVGGPALRRVGHRLLSLGHRRPPAQPDGRGPAGGLAVGDPRGRRDALRRLRTVAGRHPFPPLRGRELAVGGPLGSS